MLRLFCQDHPDLYEIDATVIEVRPGSVLVDCAPFFPGGGGQLADRGTLDWGKGRTAVGAITLDPRGVWLDCQSAALPRCGSRVRLSVDRGFRDLMSTLHTVAHIANAVVFQAFDGALLTGAQLSADATLRLDFDLPGADNNRLRAMEDPINEVIRQDLPVRTATLAWDEAEASPGMFRSKAVSPPRSEDGLVRVVEIVGLDRQACGGTHLASTGQSRPVKILKVDNKGRHNRRVRIGLVEDLRRS